MICELNRKVIRITGKESLSFLNSLCTKQLLDIKQNSCLYACILTPESKFNFDLFVYQSTPEEILVEAPFKLADGIVRFLTSYKLRLKIDISLQENMKTYFSTESVNHERSYPDPRKESLGFRIITDQEISTNSDESSYHDLMIKNTVAIGEWLEREKSFILEYGYHNINAVDFYKGCYMGQELVMRTKTTGEIRKSLITLNKKPTTANASVDESKTIMLNGGRAGKLVAVSSDKSQILALLKNDIQNSIAIFIEGEVYAN